MFSRIAAALSDLPESQRALRTAIELARACNSELATVSILGDLPAYSSLAIVVDAGAPNAMKEDRRRAHGECTRKHHCWPMSMEFRSKGSIVEGRKVQAILHFLKEERSDLLVFRLWSSVYDLAQEAPCSVLGVH
jgi:nucleotide-binding universal stress UspA family protein